MPSITQRDANINNISLQILKDFPEEMKGELGLHLHKEMLNLPIFEDATPGCLKSIALHTRRSFCAPGEFLVHKGDAANYLYLLSSGSMEILKTDLVVAILGKFPINLHSSLVRTNTCK